MADPATGARILGVFAHPDDEVFCAGGTFASYAEAGADVAVVSATRGQAGQIRDPSAATRRTLGAVRERELQEACAALGVAHAACWDFTDGRLQEAGEALSDAVEDCLVELDPDVVVTFGPDGLTGHPDHIAIGQATTTAFLRVLADAPGERRLYHTSPPRSSGLLLQRLADWLTTLDESFRGDPEFLRAMSLFSQETATMRFISDHVDVDWFPPGFLIVEQGEVGDSLYLILSGTVIARREEPDGTLRELGRLTAGQFFGELALAGGGVRSAHVQAETGVTCLVLAPGAPTAFAGRGGDAALVGPRGRGTTDGEVGREATTIIDVTAQVGRKVAALSAYRSQHALETRFLPPALLEDLFGQERFLRVHPPMPVEQDLLPVDRGSGVDPRLGDGPTPGTRES